MDKSSLRYDLEEQTFLFTLGIRHGVGGIKWAREQWTDIHQLLRSSGSVVANGIEANNAVSKPDFLFRIRTLYKESDELAHILATILKISLT